MYLVTATPSAHRPGNGGHLQLQGQGLHILCVWLWACGARPRIPSEVLLRLYDSVTHTHTPPTRLWARGVDCCHTNSPLLTRLVLTDKRVCVSLSGYGRFIPCRVVELCMCTQEMYAVFRVFEFVCSVTDNMVKFCINNEPTVPWYS